MTNDVENAPSRLVPDDGNTQVTKSEEKDTDKEILALLTNISNKATDAADQALSDQTTALENNRLFYKLRHATTWLIVIVVPSFILAALWLLLSHLNPEDASAVALRLLEGASFGAAGIGIGFWLGFSVSKRPAEPVAGPHPGDKHQS